MKKLLLKYTAISLSIAALLSPIPALAATWLPTDNFDSYSAGSSLNGDSGGSGWSGNWVVDVVPVTTENAPAGMSGKAAKFIWTSGDGGAGHRTFSSINPTTSGTTEMTYQFMAAQTNMNGYLGLSQAGVAGRAGVTFDTDGHIRNLYGVSTDLGTYTANTIYTIKIKFGHASGKYAVSINGGAYSTDFSLNGTSPWLIDNLFFANANLTTSVFWLDDIKDPNPPAPVSTPAVQDIIFF